LREGEQSLSLPWRFKMANNLLIDPIYLDTAGVIDTGHVSNILKYIEWINPVTAGDTILLTAADGAIIVSWTCPVNNQGYFKFFGDTGCEFEGPFTLTTLDSGSLLIGRV